ncbi:hypothetical protein [Spirosoma litoris]
MKFFVPFSTNTEQAERICQRVEKRLIGMGFSPLKNRMYQVVFYRDELLVTDTVGHPCPLTGEIVIAIFKNDLGYLICSYSRGVTAGDPILAKYSTVQSAIAFDE